MNNPYPYLLFNGPLFVNYDIGGRRSSLHVYRSLKGDISIIRYYTKPLALTTKYLDVRLSFYEEEAFVLNQLLCKLGSKPSETILQLAVDLGLFAMIGFPY